MMAVLEDAIDCIGKYRFITNDPQRRLFEKETRWFLDEDARWPYSFVCICETLELDANAVRESLGLTPPTTGAHKHWSRPTTVS